MPTTTLTTLREMLGLSQEPARLSDAALVMIDFQDTYREGALLLDGVEEALDDAARLLARARRAGIPVFHVMHDAGAGTPYDTRARIGQVSAEVAPRSGEPVIVKHVPDAFAGTSLHDHLRRTSRVDLVLAGFMTHLCVSSTARGAFQLGYRPTIVASATATRALPGVTGPPVPANVLAAAALAEVADLFAVVVATPEELPD